MKIRIITFRKGTGVKVLVKGASIETIDRIVRAIGNALKDS